MLDGWRGICAIGVALFHLNLAGHFYDAPIIRHGYLFVDFFFVLSGFVITHAYAGRVASGAASHFLIRRIGRLWPLHLAVLSAFIALEVIKWGLEQQGVSYGRAAWTRDADPLSLISNAALVHAWGVHPYLTWNNPSWSISVEVAAYLAFAVTFAFAARQSILIAAGVATTSALVLAFIAPEGMGSTFDYGLARCGLGFSLGHLAHELWRRTGPIWFPTAWETVTLTLAALAVSFGAVVGLAAPFVFAALVYVFGFEGGAISRAMDRRIFRALGNWSYSIYMLQALFLAVMVPALVLGFQLAGLPSPRAHDGLLHIGSPWLMDAMAVAFVLLLIAASRLSYHWIELPGQRWVAALFSRGSVVKRALGIREPKTSAASADSTKL